MSGIKIHLEFLRWTKNYAVFTYSTTNKTGIVYIPRDQLFQDEVREVELNHLIFQPTKRKEGQ